MRRYKYIRRKRKNQLSVCKELYEEFDEVGLREATRFEGVAKCRFPPVYSWCEIAGGL